METSEFEKELASFSPPERKIPKPKVGKFFADRLKFPSYGKLNQNLSEMEGRCVYCSKDLEGWGNTDHVVPRWICKKYPSVRKKSDNYDQKIKANLVKSCQTCNYMKGPIPVSIFLEYRNDSLRLKRIHSNWGLIILYWDQLPAAYKRRAIRAFLGQKT